MATGDPLLYGGNTYRVIIGWIDTTTGSATNIPQKRPTVTVAGGSAQDAINAVIDLLALTPKDPTTADITGLYTVGTPLGNAAAVMGGTANVPPTGADVEFMAIQMVESTINSVLIFSKEEA